jgi:peptidoglycan/xylan/chitin deacetylase (PgdA/CDA1 family)
MPLPTFVRQMRWLAATHDVVTVNDFVDRLTSGASLRRTAAITFDDAYVGVFEAAWPLLRDLGLPATVFVVAQAPAQGADFWWDHPAVLRAHSPARHEHWLTTLRGDGAAIVASLGHPPSSSPHGADPVRPPRSCRPADWQTITEAARSGLQLGVHSATHRSLPALDDIDLQREVIESRAEIMRRTGVTPEFFAYPYGRWNDRIREAVRAAGYRAAFALERGHGTGTDSWALPRLNVPAGIGDPAFQAWTAGLHP